MTIILLKDIYGGDIDGVFTAETTTADEIQDIINNIKANKHDWTLRDIINALPEDCTLHTKWALRQVTY